MKRSNNKNIFLRVLLASIIAGGFFNLFMISIYLGSLIKLFGNFLFAFFIVFISSYVNHYFEKRLDDVTICCALWGLYNTCIFLFNKGYFLFFKANLQYETLLALIMISIIQAIFFTKIGYLASEFILNEFKVKI